MSSRTPCRGRTRPLRRGAVPDNVAAWLHTIVRNRAIDVVRSHPGRRGVPLEDHDGPAIDTPDAAFDRRESVHAALSAIDGLPGRQRSALLGAVFAGTSYEDLAAEQGTTVSAMKTLLVRARRTVRAAAAAILPFPGAVRARLWLMGGHVSAAAGGMTGTVVKSCAAVAAVGAATFAVAPSLPLSVHPAVAEVVRGVPAHLNDAQLDHLAAHHVTRPASPAPRSADPDEYSATGGAVAPVICLEREYESC